MISKEVDDSSRYRGSHCTAQHGLAHRKSKRMSADVQRPERLVCTNEMVEAEVVDLGEDTVGRIVEGDQGPMCADWIRQPQSLLLTWHLRRRKPLTGCMSSVGEGSKEACRRH